MIQFDEHIFQMGWFNHQLAEDFLKAGAIAGEPLKKFLGEVDFEVFCRVSIEWPAFFLNLKHASDMGR